MENKSYDYKKKASELIKLCKGKSIRCADSYKGIIIGLDSLAELENDFFYDTVLDLCSSGKIRFAVAHDNSSTTHTNKMPQVLKDKITIYNSSLVMFGAVDYLLVTSQTKKQAKDFSNLTNKTFFNLTQEFKDSSLSIRQHIDKEIVTKMTTAQVATFANFFDLSPRVIESKDFSYTHQIITYFYENNSEDDAIEKLKVYYNAPISDLTSVYTVLIKAIATYPIFRNVHNDIALMLKRASVVKIKEQKCTFNIIHKLSGE